MKCNINRTTNNIDIAKVFGPEFDKSPEEIINIIRKVIAIKVIDTTFNPIEVEVAMYNSDYYVRPGVAKYSFMMKSAKLSQKIKREYSEMGDDMVYFFLLTGMLGIIKQSFDEEYFEEQVKQRASNKMIAINKDKLRMYLKKLDRSKLESFLNMVISCRLEKGWFITNASSTEFWAKIHESCRAAGVNVPEALDTGEGQKFLKSNKNFYFNALDTKVIANMLCDAIDLNIDMATSAAKKLYNYGCDAMIDYIKRETKIRT